MKNVLSSFCLALAIIAQVIWFVPGILAGLCANIESVAIGNGLSFGVFLDEVLIPTNHYLWHFHGWTIA